MITVQKRTENWYQDLGIGDFQDAVMPVLRGYESAVCYGMSMGAFAALLYSGSIDAACLAVSPMISIHPKYPEFGLEEYREKVTINHVDLREAPKSSQDILVIYDPAEKKDEIYVGAEVIPAFPSAHIVDAIFTGHPSTKALAEMGLLKGIVLDFIRNRSVPNVQALMRGRKALSAKYLSCLAEHCAGRRKTALSCALYDRAIARAQEPEKVRRLLAERAALECPAASAA